VLSDRRSLTLGLLLILALVSVLLNVVTNDLTNGSADALPVFRVLREWSLPALAVLVVLLLGGQVLLFVLERPGRRRWNVRRPPYPGLERFTEEDAAVFFGREAETRELVERLSPAVGQPVHRFVAVVGPSGSGKSSLVQAGLLPALAGQRRRTYRLERREAEDAATNRVWRWTGREFSEAVAGASEEHLRRRAEGMLEL